MTNYWVSWWNPDDAEFTLQSAWWISGYSDDATSICAAIKAENEDEVMKIIDEAYGETDVPYEMRFVEERPDDWKPYNSRFRKADWMPEW